MNWGTGAELITAIATLLWPLIALSALIVIPRFIMTILKQRGVSLRIAGFEIATEDALQQYGGDIAELQARIATLEEQLREKDDGAAAKERSTAPEERRVSILWVDDYPINNAFIVERLRGQGDRVDLALNTQDGLRMAGTGQYDAIISDLGRKEDGVDNPNAGLDLLNALKARGYDKPVLIHASRRALKIRDQLIDAGAEDVTNSHVGAFAFIDRVRGG